MKKELSINNLSSEKIWDYENGFYWYSSPDRISKLIAHYELYKMVSDLPGSIVEFGVFKGNSLIQFATFREMLELPITRKIYAFDVFGKFPTENLSNQSDHMFIDKFTKETGGYIELEDIKNIFSYKNMIESINFIKGNVFDTVDEFLKLNPEVRFNLVHLDMDVYEPTKFVLEKIYDRIVLGGIIMIDDYNAVAGATKAIDEFLNIKSNLKIEKLRFSHIPSFIIKK